MALSQVEAASRQAFVLTLDDDEAVGAFVRATLPDQRFRTAWRPDVGSAIASVENDPPDLAIIDIDLKADGTGWELLRFLRANPRTATVPVVMLTGASDTLNRERSLRLGADRYLIKPVRPDTL